MTATAAPPLDGAPRAAYFSRTMRISAACALLLAACVPARPPAAPAPKSASATRRPAEDKAKIDLAALRDRFAGEHLEGLVAVPARSVLFASRQEAEKAAPARRSASGRNFAVAFLRVIEDQGALVRVDIDLGKELRSARDFGQNVFSQLSESYAIQGWVRRDALVPVLRHHRVKTFADGTGFLLRQGLPLGTTASGVVALDPELQPLTHGLEPGEAALSIVAEPMPSLPKVDGEVMTCQPGSPTRVVSEDQVVKGQLDKRKGEPSTWTIGHGGPGLPGCTLGDESALRVAGTARWKPGQLGWDRCLDHVGVWSTAQNLLIEVSLGFALVRASGSATALEVAGGCGAGRVGYRAPPRVLAVRPGPSVAYWPDGSVAGRHYGAATLFRGGHAHGSRVCAKLPFLSRPICHERSDLVEVGDPSAR